MPYIPDEPFILFPPHISSHPMDAQQIEFLIITSGLVRVTRVFGGSIEHNNMSIYEARTEWKTSVKQGWTRK
jgi:hypothetical protein